MVQSCKPLTRSVAEKLLGVVVVRAVLSHVPLASGKEVSTEQTVEINHHHDVHHHHGDEEVPAVVHPGVVVDDVPSEVELGAEAKHDIGEEVGNFVDVVYGGGLSVGQLQHQPQVQGDAVDLHEEGDQSTGNVELGVEGVQETPDHLETEHYGEGVRTNGRLTSGLVLDNKSLTISIAISIS